MHKSKGEWVHWPGYERELSSGSPVTAVAPLPWEPSRAGPSPLRHDLEGVGQVALHVLHLERVCVTDLIVRAPVVGVLHHDDVAAWAPQLDGVAFAGQLPAHQPKWEPRPAQACGREDPAEEVPPAAKLYPG